MNEANATAKPVHKKRIIVSLWRKFLGFTESKLAFKTGIAASISLVAGVAFGELFDRPDTMVSGLWCVMAAIVVMQAHLGGTYKAAWTRFLGVLVGSIAGAIFINAIGSDAISLGISVFFTIVICALLNIKESFRIAGLSAAIIIVMGSAHPIINPWLFSLYRFIDSCIGLLVAVIVSQVIWPEKAIENIRLNMGKILNLLSKYYLLTTKLEPDIQNNSEAATSMWLEINDLLLENRDLRQEAELELFDNQPEREYLLLLSNQLEIIFEAIGALQAVHKEMLSNIFDDSLAAHVATIVDKTEASFQKLEKMMKGEEIDGAFVDLSEAIKAMNADLLRFRGTRTTRKFNLEDVESFFVYFYSLRTISEALVKMSEQIKT